ncbi:MAG TPA: hypothetical protein VI547_09085 [Anaerolineales bacterium]|nr:hypothetical protein [Anaerolineales bacterium]
MALNSAQVQAIARQVYAKFPELKGVPPEIQSQHAPGAKALGQPDYFLVVFKGRSPQNIVRVVRVTADAKGRLLKISTSR